MPTSGKINASGLSLLVRTLPGLGEHFNGSRLHHIHISSHTIYCISSHAIFSGRKHVARNGVNRLFVANFYFEYFSQTTDLRSIDSLRFAFMMMMMSFTAHSIQNKRSVAGLPHRRCIHWPQKNEGWGSNN